MKEYTFFAVLMVNGTDSVTTASTIWNGIVSKPKRLSIVTKGAMQDCVKDFEIRNGCRVSRMEQFNLIGVEEVYKDENGEIKVKED